MAHRQVNKTSQLLWLSLILIVGGILYSNEALGMGNDSKEELSGFGKEKFWKDLAKARPLIKQRADALLTELGYHPAQMIAEVYQNGEGGDVVWTVVYWQGSVETYHGDLGVYLNNQGKIRRVVKFEQGKERLIYGKDERIAKGMTHEQVTEHLGEPDYKGSPPRWARQYKDTEFWRYKKSQDRTVTIEVYFKDGKVSFFSTFGE